jgi:uncharacterized membrane protein YeaQ/YmgE (transglycosylase-associated protein family)
MGSIADISVGALIGVLAAMSIKGGAFGIVGDIAFGILGSLLGGNVAATRKRAGAGFVVSVVLAVLGAVVAIAVGREAASYLGW